MRRSTNVSRAQLSLAIAIEGFAQKEEVCRNERGAPDGKRFVQRGAYKETRMFLDILQFKNPTCGLLSKRLPKIRGLPDVF